MAPDLHARHCEEGTGCPDAAVVLLRRGGRLTWTRSCDRHAHAAALEAERYGTDLTITATGRTFAPQQR